MLDECVLFLHAILTCNGVGIKAVLLILEVSRQKMPDAREDVQFATPALPCDLLAEAPSARQGGQAVFCALHDAHGWHRRVHMIEW